MMMKRAWLLVGVILLILGAIPRIFPEIKPTFDRWWYVSQRLHEVKGLTTDESIKMSSTGVISDEQLTIESKLSTQGRIYAIDPESSQVEIIYDDETVYIIRGLIPWAKTHGWPFGGLPSTASHLVSLEDLVVTEGLSFSVENLTGFDDVYVEKGIKSFNKVVLVQGYIPIDDLCRQGDDSQGIDDFCTQDFTSASTI